MASSKLIFASALIVLSLINLSTSYFVEQTLSPNWFSSPENSQEKDKKFLNVLENVEIENLPILNKQLTTSSNNIDNYHEYQHSTCQLVNIIHLLKHTGCQPKAISSFACSGSCSSYVQLSTSKFWQHERSCSCCQQTGLQEATFTLDCPSLDPPYKKIKTYAPVDCMCRACTDLGRENLQPQELIEALAGESTRDIK